jgi:hypothetical protein
MFIVDQWYEQSRAKGFERRTGESTKQFTERIKRIEEFRALKTEAERDAYTEKFFETYDSDV